MGLSNSVYYLRGCCLRHQWENVVWEVGQGWNGLLAFITSRPERLPASETQVHQTLRQLHRGNKGQRDGEAGLSPLDQLIRQPETEEQLRKLVPLFSQKCRDGGQKFIKPSFYSTDQGSFFLSCFLFFCSEIEQFKTTFRFQNYTKMCYLYPCMWNLYQHWSIS